MLTFKRKAEASTSFAVVAGLALAFAVSAPAASAQSTPPTLQALMPKDTVMAGGVQANWLWDSAVSIRKEPAVSKLIGKAEAYMGLSIENDIKPWAGRIGFAGYGATKDDMQATFYFEIRDQLKFMATLAKVQEKLKNPPADAKPGSTPQFTSRDYNGVTVFDLTEKPAILPKNVHTPVDKDPVSIAIVDGWALVSIGKGAIEHALDADQGRFPSIQTSPVWSPVLAKLSPDANSWGGFDLGGLEKAFGGGLPPGQVPGAILAAMQSCTAFSFTDEGKGFRVDVITAPQSARGKAIYAKMARNMPPVSGQILKRVPDAVFAAMFTNPSYIWTIFKASMLDTASSPKERKEIQAGLNQMPGLENTLPYFHKDAGFVLTWRKDRGFGLVLLAQGDTHNAALHAAGAIAAAIKQMGVPLQRGGNSWAAAIPGLDMMVPPTVPVKLSPFLSAKDDWLVLGSSPSWTAPSTSTPNLQIPAYGTGSSVTELVTMKFLPALLDTIQQSAPADNLDVKQGFDLVRGWHLETANIAGTWQIAPDGTWSIGTTEVTNWDWRAAIDSSVTAAHNWKHDQKATGHDLLKQQTSDVAHPHAGA